MRLMRDEAVEESECYSEQSVRVRTCIITWSRLTVLGLLQRDTWVHSTDLTQERETISVSMCISLIVIAKD